MELVSRTDEVEEENINAMNQARRANTSRVGRRLELELSIRIQKIFFMCTTIEIVMHAEYIKSLGRALLLMLSHS